MHRFSRSRLVPTALLAAGLALPIVAYAINQPDGTPIPVGGALQGVFTAAGDPVDAVTEAAITPETFVPGCRLTFTVTSRGTALFQDSFGWYNVTGSRPDDSDLHVLIPCGSAAAFVATLDLRHEPAYRGGQIGFFLRTPQTSATEQSCAGGDCCATVAHTGFTYYTERSYNPDSMGASSYIHLLIYNSHTTPNAFYFAWEDLYAGGDNNFTDFVAQVGNIACTGAGGACSTGGMGVCGQGVQQCRGGALACVQAVMPRAEACNGLDDDCNGTVDDGTGLCPASQVCERGACVDRCVEGSCFAGFTCSTEGTCVETACATVSCPAGQRCAGGACVGACDGVTCPASQTCRDGRCVDPCAGVTCDDDQVCAAGVCVPLCQCRACAAGQTCQADGHCVASDCAAVTCPSGMVCTAGACHDACDGAVCPHGEVCTAGQCVAATTMDAGVDASLGDVTQPRHDAASDVRSLDVAADGGAVTRRSGCACRATPTRTAHDAWPWAAALALLAARRRRRA